MAKPVLLLCLGIAMVVTAHLLRVATSTPLYEYWLESTAGNAVFLLLGATILVRRPNVIGWVFLVTGLTGSLQFVSGQYTVTSMEVGWPAAEWLGLLSRAMQLITVFSFLFLLLLFPTGRTLSPRWRPVLIAAMFFAAVAVATGATSRAAQADEFDGLGNPLATPSLESLRSGAEAVAGIATAVLLVAALIGIVLRARRASGIERLQMKTFAFGAILGISLVVFGSMLVPASVDDVTGSIVWTLGPLCLPASAGLAILRYRLYDIDLIVNKTLVYGGLTGVLAAVYVGLVFALQGLLDPVTGKSDLAIAASTLAVAGLFRPARARMQRFIDHRFYRRKVDVQETLGTFGDHLRDDVDLASLGARLQDVVRETMQPTHVSLWLREVPR